ncbi:Protein CBG15321 [Caenorhabditis briggsae]|uniref:Protein CBG15321 n=2 Tax=Caenorhabditis briggsae TaxID=6238 RepID=A8XLX7_CAEBR|nr:Protein CBG15321 [Caenorhabditis briggsae]ULU03390.1 hypothetical protein L3Y34_002745 [Caenorhabditis briggsae]CAP33652.1 Protein CBG15321 [Caenorhabditis briggsae]
MVQSKAGILGAVAHQVQKRKTGPDPPKKSNRPQATKKQSKKNEKVETRSQTRKNNELFLLQKEMEKGTNVENMTIGKWDKKLTKMETDEKSDEEPSDEHKEPGDLKTKEAKANEPITDKKKLKKYKVDREDYMLQMATADEEPLYFEEYQPRNYDCFLEVPIVKWANMVPDTFKRLLKYTNEVLQNHTPPNTYHLPSPLLKSKSFRHTVPYTNFCFSPLQAMRAWALLYSIAQNKTAKELKTFVEEYTRESSTTPEDFHQQLLSLHRDAEYQFEGCVRLFTEMPRHLPHNVKLRRETNVLYGGRSRRASIQHHSFATDSDGFYSCYRINEEIARSTRGLVRYVVPENCAPNWRASIALASAQDCTFYWKVTDSEESSSYRFNGGSTIPNSKCSVLSGKANVWIKKAASGQDVYKLESHVPNVQLFIFMEDLSQASKPKALPSDIFSIVSSLDDSWILKPDQHISIPKCTTSTPISLYDHAKKNGLSRLFSSEKSELRQLKASQLDYSGSPQFQTLFDHYHKTVFQICPHPPNNEIRRRFDHLAPEKAHQCIEESAAKLFASYQVGAVDNHDVFFTYHEDHLDQSTGPLLLFPGNFEYDKAQFCDLDIAKPFYYVMTRQFAGAPMIVCAGYFVRISEF